MLMTVYSTGGTAFAAIHTVVTVRMGRSATWTAQENPRQCVAEHGLTASTPSTVHPVLYTHVSLSYTPISKRYNVYNISSCKLLVSKQ